MVSTSHLAMHQEHAQWRAENNSWREDLAVWEHELDEAIARIPDLEESLRRHAGFLKRHGASIRIIEQDPAAHEHVLADYERGETPGALVELAQTHRREAEEHAHQREKHDEIKYQHRHIMTKWRQLLAALARAKPAAPIAAGSNSTTNAPAVIPPA
jgi:hypothetical protein